VEDIVQNVKNNGDHKATIKTTAQKQHHGIFLIFFFQLMNSKNIDSQSVSRLAWTNRHIVNNYSNLKQFLISIT